MEEKEHKEIIESLLFVTEGPITIEKIKSVVDLSKGKIKEIISHLQQEYLDNHSLRIREVAGGYQVVTDPKYAPWLRKLFQKDRKERLTRPALETLAIIAYRQPITRPEIEYLRGVDVDGVVKSLLEKGLIRIAGRKKTVGNPFLYTTTKRFLEYFGLNSLEELPNIEELVNLEGSEIGDKKIEEENR
jgi:segregation and condensation protein B